MNGVIAAAQSADNLTWPDTVTVAVMVAAVVIVIWLILRYS